MSSEEMYRFIKDWLDSGERIEMQWRTILYHCLDLLEKEIKLTENTNE